MWTETTRPKYERSGLRYASDLTDAEWKVIGSLLPARALERRLQVTGQGVQGVGVVPDLHVSGVGLAATRAEGCRS